MNYIWVTFRVESPRMIQLENYELAIANAWVVLSMHNFPRKVLVRV